MRNLDLNVGELCNNACVFCGNGTATVAARAWSAPRERIVEELDRAAADGIRSVCLLGGEVTVHPHALWLIDAARARGFRRIAVCTNGRRFADARLVDAFIAAGMTRVALSIHSHVEADEDRLNGRKKAFAQKLDAIVHLTRAAARNALPDGFALNSCIHGLNHRALCEMATFFHERGVRDIRFNLVRPEHEAMGDAAIIPRLSDCAPALLRLVSHNERTLRMNVTFGDVPLCMWPDEVLRDEALHRRYVGELRDLDTSVAAFRGADPRGTPDRFDWRERRASMLKGYAPACEECAARDECEGPWLRYLEMYGGEELRPIERRAPRSATHLDLVVSDACNNRCRFCLGDRSARPPADLAEPRRALEAHAHRDGVRFTGGEPTTSEGLPELIAHARGLGYREIGLVTNGRRLAYRGYCRRLVDAGLTEVTVSIHGPTAEVHDDLTQARGSFDQSVAGMRNVAELRRAGARLAIATRTVVARRNLAHLGDTARLLAGLGAERIIFELVGDDARGRLEWVVPSMEEGSQALGPALEVRGVECRMEGRSLSSRPDGGEREGAP